MLDSKTAFEQSLTIFMAIPRENYLKLNIPKEEAITSCRREKAKKNQRLKRSSVGRK